MENIIVIPIYKEIPSDLELVSLRQVCSILNNHKFSIVCSNNLKLDYYLDIFHSFDILYQINYFDKIFFDSTSSYNQLMLNINFYKCFIDYDYMLIYQLDAYIFKDELKYWCKKNYDYIGAPWFDNWTNADNKSVLLKNAGNGGFSLRKIAAFINVLDKDSRESKIVSDFIRQKKNEDGFYSMHAVTISNSFKVAPPEIAMFFSFECLPKKLFKMTNKKLPFGCHAWYKYNPEFWKNFINF